MGPAPRWSWLPVLYDPAGALPRRINTWFALWGADLVLTAAGPLLSGCGALTHLAFGQRVLHGQ